MSTFTCISVRFDCFPGPASCFPNKEDIQGVSLTFGRLWSLAAPVPGGASRPFYFFKIKRSFKKFLKKIQGFYRHSWRCPRGATKISVLWDFGVESGRGSATEHRFRIVKDGDRGPLQRLLKTLDKLKFWSWRNFWCDPEETEKLCFCSAEMYCTGWLPVSKPATDLLVNLMFPRTEQTLFFTRKSKNRASEQQWNTRLAQKMRSKKQAAFENTILRFSACCFWWQGANDLVFA